MGALTRKGSPVDLGGAIKWRVWGWWQVHEWDMLLGKRGIRDLKSL